jgi:hypothetical protein
MWPFDSLKVEKLAAEALAPGALPSARKKAIDALMALPQTARSLECYSRIALDPKQVWDTRYKALAAMKLSPNPAGARAMLRCLESDLRSPALQLLGAETMSAAVRELGAEAIAVLARTLEQVAGETEARALERQLAEFETLGQLLARIGTPEAKALGARLDPSWLEARNRQVPSLLHRALTSKYHREVAESVRALERLASPEAKAALEKFRRSPSRLVEKTVIGGVGAREESYRQQVDTSEFGQQRSAAPTAEPVLPAEKKPVPRPAPSSALDAAPPAADVPAPEPDLAQDYVAASARGIQDELLALVADQIGLLHSLHRNGSLAPVGAYMDAKGEIFGLALTTENATATDGSVQGTLDFFRDKFRAEAPAGRIAACAAFYHGCHGAGRGQPHVTPAQEVDQADCIVARLDHDSGQAVTCVIQYEANADGEWRYAPPYYALRRPDIFLDRDYQPLLPDRLGMPRWSRRPAQASDCGTHPELMTLLESHMPLLQSLLESDSLAPVAATLKPSGEIQAHMLFNRDVWASQGLQTDPTDPVVLYPLGPAEETPEGAIRFFIDLFRAAADQGEIVATAIFFHGIYTTTRAAELGIMPAKIGEEPNCLIAMLDHRLSQTMSVVQRYARDARGEWQFAPATHHPAFPSIFNPTGTSFLDQS